MHYQPPAHTGLNILYQDEQLLIVDKPAGLLSVPGRGEDKQDCLATRVQAEYPEALIVHRLDMATSGLIIMAKSEDMQRHLSMLFEKREIEKRYIAIVDGRLEQETGKINFPLITDWPNRPKQKVDHQTGKPALTFYKVLERTTANHTTRIELTPKTGRTHQLRVHMQAIGHAIVGDRLYASEEVQRNSARLLLHAERLIFIHPVTEEQISIQSQVPF